jgi:ABC-2 type transport system ATP-binding protein
MEIEITDLTVYGARSGRGRLKRHCGAGREINPVLQRLTGKFFCGVNLILGPNGTGKSLLMRVLAGIVPPERGMIMLEGRSAGPPVLRKNCSYLPQTFGFYPQYSAREMLRYFGLLKGLIAPRALEAQVDKVLQLTDLLEAADRKLGGYSRGMRQKVGIAQALLGDPPVLLLDDPTAGLDPESRDSFRGMMAELGRNHVIIWASALISDTACADRVLVLDRGEPRFWGTPVELGSCARLPVVSPLVSSDGMKDESWFKQLERGYRAALAGREE